MLKIVELLELDTMARKLSNFALSATRLTAAVLGCVIAQIVFAQEPAQTIANPFASNGPKAAALSTTTEQQTPHRAPTYQNPFSAASKKPPVDTSLRPGPVSRWQHPVIPKDEVTSIKTAVLATPASAPDQPTWDQLPPAEDLRHRVADRPKESDPTFYSRLAHMPDAIQFTPKPLTQPEWIKGETDGKLATASIPIVVDPAVFDEPLKAPKRGQEASATVAVTTPPLSAPLASGSIEPSPTSIANPLASLPATTEPATFINPLAVPPIKTGIPHVTISDSSESAESWLAQAQQSAGEANSMQDLAAVIQLCDRGVQAHPSAKLAMSLRRLAAWAHNRRGELEAEEGKNNESLSDFQVAISLDPNCSLAIHNRAVTLAQQNQFPAALRDFNRVIELNPGLAVAYRNRAELLAALGKIDEAVADYNRAIDGLPNDAQLYRDRAYAYARTGELRKAAADLDRAIEKSPNDPDAYTQRGNLAAENGKYAQALADFHHAIDVNPKWSDAHRSLAWLDATCPNSQFRNPKQALEAAQEAANLSIGDNYVILDTLAAAHASAGQFDDAIAAQRKAIACAPPDEVSAMKERLTLYQGGHPFHSTPVKSEVRQASLEIPVDANPPEPRDDRDR
jgi:tetratricopeptide (TPR) repeat protein